MSVDENLKEAIRRLVEVGRPLTAQYLTDGGSPADAARWIRMGLTGHRDPTPGEAQALAILDSLSGSPASTGEGGSRGQGEGITDALGHLAADAAEVGSHGAPIVGLAALATEHGAPAWRVAAYLASMYARDTGEREILNQALRVLRGES